MEILRKVAVIGSRSLKDYDYLKSYLDRFVLCHIVSGGASGADRLVERYAKEKNILFTCIFPDYIKYGRVAPLVRNKHIIEQVNHCIAFWDGESKGTDYTIKLAEKAGMPVKVVSYIQGRI